jgi:hypothetical protein
MEWQGENMRDEVVSTGYTPRKHQDDVHRALKRFNVLCCHRRFGKTVMVINEIYDKALHNGLKNPHYAYIAPTYGQAKRVAWEYFKEFGKNIPGFDYWDGDLRIQIERSWMPEPDTVTIWLLGAENPGSIRGIYLDGCVVDEYAECDPIVWTQVLRPALSDRKGWAIFIGTPKGQNHFYDIYEVAATGANKDWYAAIYKASDTNIIDADELEAAALTMSDEEYEQEFECSFTAALIGAYYGKQIAKAEEDGRIGRVACERSVPVDTFWDLGIGDTTAVWFLQQVGREYHLIDYLEQGGVG